jgi:hypothetical protein
MTGFIVPQLQEVVKMEEPVTNNEPVTDNATAKAKAKAKAKGKPKAKSTARRQRGARHPALVSFKKRSVMASKRPPVVKEKEASSPDAADREEGVKPELAAQAEESKQLILNMDKGGAMRLDDPQKVMRKDLKGPDIGGDFSKARNSKRTTCCLRDFRSHAYMYRAIWQGRFRKTSSGLKKDDLTVSITGKIVPKRRSAHCRKIGTDNGWIDHWRLWLRATRDARDALGVSGFMKVKKNGSDDEMALFARIVANYTSTKKRRPPAAAAEEAVAAEEA